MDPEANISANLPGNETAPGGGANGWHTHPFVRGLSPELLATLASCAMPTTFRAGEVIFREGEMANRFYLVLHGRVQLEAEVRDRPGVIVDEIGGGDVLGWSWLFPPYTWNFSAIALEPVQAVFFYGTWLRERSETDLSLGYELMKRTAVVLMRRLQATRQQLVQSVAG